MMRLARFAGVFGLCSFLFVLLAADCAMAQGGVSADFGGQEFDCVIKPKALIKLGSADNGIVEVLTVDRGQIVKKGDVVARLDSNLQRTQVELTRLKAKSRVDIDSEKARLAYRKIAASRAESLYSKHFGSAKDRDTADTEQQLAQLALNKAELNHKIAQVELEQAKARLDRRSIRSPVDGVIADVTTAPGEYVYDQAPLMTIAEINPLYVNVFLPVRDYDNVKIGTIAEIRPEQPIGGVYRAKVTVIDRVFDAASSTFGVRLEIPNPTYSLPGGLRCRVRFGK